MLKPFLPFEVTAPLVKVVYYCKNPLVVDGVSALSVRELEGFLGYGQVSGFREDAEYTVYGGILGVNFYLIVAVAHGILQDRSRHQLFLKLSEVEITDGSPVKVVSLLYKG